MIVINPQYEHLRAWIESLPDTFFQQGEIIYDARNQIRVIGDWCVKRYHAPRFLNRLIYSFIRSPKAVRAYENARILLRNGIPTPEPVAYMVCGKSLIKESFLITRCIPSTHMMYEFGDGDISGRETIIRALGKMTAQMHKAGILHLDYSPGNILFRQDGTDIRFWFVDINRMQFGRISPKEGCRNFARLWGNRNMYELLAESYAAERELDAAWCLKEMMTAHNRFWKHRHPERFFNYRP